MKQSTFDQIILDNLIEKEGAASFGYRNTEDKVYCEYYTKEKFEEFKTKMKQRHFEKFSAGKGSELKPKRNGIIPPKMASVASSSRFCYLALCDGAPHVGIDDSVEFEYECKVGAKRGTHPQLDACCYKNHVYVEAKCHEIFNNAKETTLGKSYAEFIYGIKDHIGFDLPTDEMPAERFVIPYEQFGLTEFPTYFDLKQFLCHLWGVAAQEREADKTLMYLFFRPKTNDDNLHTELEAVFAELQTEIAAVFGSRAVNVFCQDNRITLKAVYQYSDVMEPLTKENTCLLY